MKGVLPPSFFARPADIVAKELLGKVLVREADGIHIEGIINETEAYMGPHDLACHASKGRTNRTEVMFGPAGIFYVYFVYGMHWMLNIVTGEADYPAAVLLRGVNGITGPARLTKHFQVSGALNGKPAAKESGLWVCESDIDMSQMHIRTTPRIGVDYAGEWAAKPLRYILEEKA